MKTREWFAHAHGCVNLDDDTIYFTHSGNWSETQKLKEKTRQVERANHWNQAWTYVFIGLALLFFVFLMVGQYLNGTWSFTLFLLAIGLGVKLYAYMKNELGPTFKIPIAKIKKITLQDKQCTLWFVTGESKEAQQELKGVEAKGIQLLTALQKKLASNSPT